MKTCKDCLKERPLESFKLQKNGDRIGVCFTCLGQREYQANPGRMRRKAARKRQSHPDAALLKDCRSSDRKWNREGNDLDREFVREAITKPCTYCGATSLKMTLDRIDNDLAHTKANVIPACIRCNYMRGSMPYPAWLNLVHAIKDTFEKGLFGEWRSTTFNQKHSNLGPAYEELTEAEKTAIRQATAPKARPLIEWPPNEELEAEVAATSLRTVAKRLGVGHVTLARRIGRYGKNKHFD